MADNNGSVPVRLNEQPFVGLSNQGATCYMNSLLQTLWMTPEFRREVYRWTYDPSSHGPAADCIPLQLQLLFARLQLRQSSCINTKALTRSFQWDVRESFQQHDVQEFCRVLFDALEHSVLGTAQQQFIQDLCQGTYVDYVKCRACQTESAREDQFLDVSLTVKNPFEQVYNSSVTEALKNYVKPEELTGDNQYFCSQCNCKQDALKGLKFHRLPYVLMLQLKRFDLDFMTMKRVKLNDQVTFPHVLNMNPYVSQTFNVLEENGEDLPSSLPADRYLEQGAYVYELYSVLVHSGSALGGHYFAYIKDQDTDRWFQFNDAAVKQVSVKEVETAFGMNAHVNSSATAYMLLYRQVDRARNLKQVSDAEVPTYVQQLIGEEEAAIARAEQERLEAMNKVTVHVYYQDQAKVLSTQKTTTVLELSWQAAEAFGLDPAQVRLRHYAVDLDVMREVLSPASCLVVLPGSCTLGIETKLPEEEWLPYDPNIVTFFVQVWDDEFRESGKVNEPLRLTADKRNTLEELRYQLEGVVGIPAEHMNVLKKGYMSTIPESVVCSAYLSQPLSHIRLSDRSMLYIEPLQDTSRWVAFLKEEADKYLVRFNNIDGSRNPNGHIEYLNSVHIGASKSLKDLKELLAAHQGVSVDEFVLRRGSEYASEIKDLSVAINQANLTRNCCVHLQRGTPSRPGEFRVKFYLAKQPRPEEIDGTLYSFEFLCELAVQGSTTVQEIKETLASKLEVPPATLRVREKFHDALGKVLQTSDCLSQYQLSDRKCFSVQALAEPDQDMTHAWTVATCRRWQPSTWELTPATELFVSKDWTAREFGAVLAAEYGVALSQLGVFKVNYCYSFMRSELDLNNFLRIGDEDFVVTDKPWFLGNDSALFIIVDLEEPVRVMTGEERRKYRIPSLNTLAGWSPPKETSVKITVRSRQDSGSQEEECK